MTIRFLSSELRRPWPCRVGQRSTSIRLAARGLKKRDSDAAGVARDGDFPKRAGTGDSNTVIWLARLMQELYGLKSGVARRQRAPEAGPRCR